MPWASDTSIVQMDQVIIGISNLTNGSYYEVFNWGDNNRDKNTNVDTNGLPPASNCTVPSMPECDNRNIPMSSPLPYSSLYGSPPNKTGILIDVDTANGAPPPGTYNYLVIVSPIDTGLDGTNIDSVVVAEIPIPSDRPLAIVKSEEAAPGSVEDNEPASSADTTDPPANDPALPAEDSNSPPADSASSSSSNDPALSADSADSSSGSDSALSADSSGPSTSDPAPSADSAPAQQ